MPSMLLTFVLFHRILYKVHHSSGYAQCAFFHTTMSACAKRTHQPFLCCVFTAWAVVSVLKAGRSPARQQITKLSTITSLARRPRLHLPRHKMTTTGSRRVESKVSIVADMRIETRLVARMALILQSLEKGRFSSRWASWWRTSSTPRYAHCTALAINLLVQVQLIRVLLLLPYLLSSLLLLLLLCSLLISCILLKMGDECCCYSTNCH